MSGERERKRERKCGPGCAPGCAHLDPRLFGGVGCYKREMMRERERARERETGRDRGRGGGGESQPATRGLWRSKVMSSDTHSNLRLGARSSGSGARSNGLGVWV